MKLLAIAVFCFACGFAEGSKESSIHEEDLVLVCASQETKTPNFQTEFFPTLQKELDRQWHANKFRSIEPQIVQVSPPDENGFLKFKFLDGVTIRGPYLFPYEQLSNAQMKKLAKDISRWILPPTPKQISIVSRRL